MSSKAKPVKKLRRFFGTVFSIASLAILTYVAIALIFGVSLDFQTLTSLLRPRVPVAMADAYSFDVGRDRVFADTGDFLAAAGTLGAQVLDMGGNEVLRYPFRMSHPAIYASNGQAIVFDIGGYAVRLFRGGRLVASVNKRGAVVSASVNRNGWFCVSTQEGGGYSGLATVYSSNGNAVYEVFKGTGYILSAILSPDNRTLAVLRLTSLGSRVTLYHGLDKEEADSAFYLPGGLIIDIHFLPGGNLLAIAKDSLILIDMNGHGTEIFSFSGGRLGKYAIDGDNITLHLLDYGIGHSGRLVRLSQDGALLAQVLTDREIISLSPRDGYLAVLRSDSLVFYDSELEELSASGEHESPVGSSVVLALGDGTALAAGDHSAVLFRVTRSS